MWKQACDSEFQLLACDRMTRDALATPPRCKVLPTRRYPAREQKSARIRPWNADDPL